MNEEEKKRIKTTLQSYKEQIGVICSYLELLYGNTPLDNEHQRDMSENALEKVRDALMAINSLMSALFTNATEHAHRA